MRGEWTFFGPCSEECGSSRYAMHAHRVTGLEPSSPLTFVVVDDLEHLMQPRTSAPTLIKSSGSLNPIP